MVSDDPIGRMFKRGQLRRETARGGKTADDRLKAARMWQSIYADLPGAQLSPDKRKAVQAMSELRVLGEKLELDACSAQAPTILWARTGPMPSTSQRRSGSSSISKTFSAKAD
jgi:hypothetical protein